MTPDADTPLAATEPAHKTIQDATEPRWPSLVALMTTGIRPALTTHRTTHLRLIDAWLAHLVAMVAALFLMAVVDGMASRIHRDSIKEAVMLSLAWIVRDFQDYLDGAVVVLIGFTAVIEGGLILFATLLMALGARDEPTGDSFRHVLRRTWLHCGHVAILILVAGLVIAEIGTYQSRWHEKARQRIEHMRPSQPPVGATQDELVEYNRQVGEIWNKVYSDRPILVEYDEEATTYVVILASVWFLWALLRGLGADRPVRSPEHPPMCRACGYNLTGLPPDGRCPECGRPVAESIGPDASPGAAWEHPTDVDGGYLQTLFAWMRSPQAQANDLRLTPARRRCATFLVITVILCGMAAGIGVGWTFWMDEVSRGGNFDHEILTIGLPIGGAIWATLLLLFAAGSAFLPAMVMLARDRRNLLSGTFQAASYSSGWLFAWTAVGVMTLAVTVLAYNQVVEPLEAIVGMPDEAIAVLGNLAVHAICGLAFVVTVYRASAGVRYACR